MHEEVLPKFDLIIILCINNIDQVKMAGKSGEAGKKPKQKNTVSQFNFPSPLRPASTNC
jgi:hypothetical protein